MAAGPAFGLTLQEAQAEAARIAVNNSSFDAWVIACTTEETVLTELHATGESAP
jgi:hypothetical protein